MDHRIRPTPTTAGRSPALFPALLGGMSLATTAGMLARSTRVTLAALSILLPTGACAVGPGGEDAAQNAGLSTTIDMADYVVPTCASAGPAWQIGGEQFRVVPMGTQGGSGRFVIVKSTDGSGYEEWSVDKDWLRIRSDTTWAYELSDHTWCDVKCGSNDGSNCQQRWNTNASDPHNGLHPSSPWAYTVYSDASSASLAAPWIPRTLKLAMGASTQYTAKMQIQGAARATCAVCGTNFSTQNGASVGRTVRAQRLASSHGFQDVVELHVLSGPGAGEVYDYARGKGWIGFNGNFASGQVGSGALPVSGCAGFQQGSICSATGGGAQLPPAPTSSQQPPPPPPPAASCACNHQVDNFCLYPAKTPNCGMTAPGGYCDPNGDGSFSDADWVRGYDDFHQACP